MKLEQKQWEFLKGNVQLGIVNLSAIKNTNEVRAQQVLQAFRNINTILNIIKEQDERAAKNSNRVR